MRGRKVIRLEGKRIGRLVVKEQFNPFKKGAAYWVCICDCGKEKVICGSSLILKKSSKQKLTQSCGCYSRELAAERGKTLNTLQKGQSEKNEWFRRYKSSAIHRNYSFEITKEEFEFLIQQKCYYCNRLPTIKFNGVDRIDNMLGYIKNNYVTCCKQCNRAKSDMSKEDFYNWIFEIYKTFAKRCGFKYVD